MLGCFHHVNLLQPFVFTIYLIWVLVSTSKYLWTHEYSITHKFLTGGSKSPSGWNPHGSKYGISKLKYPWVQIWISHKCTRALPYPQLKYKSNSIIWPLSIVSTKIHTPSPINTYKFPHKSIPLTPHHTWYTQTFVLRVDASRFFGLATNADTSSYAVWSENNHTNTI